MSERLEKSKKKRQPSTGFFIREVPGIDAVTLILDMDTFSRGHRMYFAACREATAHNWIHFLSSLNFKIEHLIGPPTPGLTAPAFRRWCEDFDISAILVDTVGNKETVVINPRSKSSQTK
jgi:hypothetical protein